MRAELVLGDDDDIDERLGDTVEESAAAFGVVLEGDTDEAAQDLPVFYLWPEHQAVFWLFIELRTQWRTGVEGPTGLDYAAVHAFLRLTGRRLSPARFEELRVMERGALIEVARQRAARRHQNG